MQRDPVRATNPRSVLSASLPLGIGLVGSLDEIVFHQLLQWHNFYVDATEYWRIFSDGLLHAFTLSMLFYGAYRLWQQRQPFSTIISSKPFWAGVLLGGGAFHLWDGIVDHKILQLHPVREDVDNILIYDIAWNAAALLLLALGWMVWRSAMASGNSRAEAPHAGRRSRV